MVEHLTCNQTVVGSIPTTSSTTKANWKQLALNNMGSLQSGQMQ